MSYSLTDNQKDIVRWLVQQVHASRLSEEFVVSWTNAGTLIVGYTGEERPNIITKAALSALEAAGMLVITPQKHSLSCALTGKAYEAVKNDFASIATQSAPQVTIGAIIHSMSGGSIQAVGIAQDAEISQVVNDPELFRSQVDALAESLLNEVKTALKVDELAEYAQAVRDLKEQVLAEKPDPSLIRRATRTAGLLGNIEGTIALTTRVWTFLHPILLIAATKLN